MRRGVWENQETVFHYREEDGVKVYYWIDGPLGYALTGNISNRALISVAQAVYETRI